MAGWINMRLGTEVCLGPGDILLHGDPSSHNSYACTERGTALFDQCLLWPNDWMHQGTTWYRGIGIGPGDIVLDENPAPPPWKGASSPTFEVYIVVKPLDGSRCHLVRR